MKEVQNTKKRDFLAFLVMVSVMLGLLFSAPIYAEFKNDKPKPDCEKICTTSCVSTTKNSENNLK